MGSISFVGLLFFASTSSSALLFGGVVGNNVFSGFSTLPSASQEKLECLWTALRALCKILLAVETSSSHFLTCADADSRASASSLACVRAAVSLADALRKLSSALEATLDASSKFPFSRVRVIC